jgi:hypothetical protein
MTQFLGTLWFVLVFVPAIFWFFVVRKFNKVQKASFPAILYSIFYLIPFVHFFISWSFVKDIAEKRANFPTKKTYFINLALPYIFLTVGLQLFVIIGVILDAIGIPFALDVFGFLATVVPYASFVWFSWGFWSLGKTIDAISTDKPAVSVGE